MHYLFSSANDSNLEMQYEKSISDRINQNGEAKVVRFMLPIKTKDGKVQAKVIETEIVEEDEPVDENLSKKAQKKKDKVEEEIAVKVCLTFHLKNCLYNFIFCLHSFISTYFLQVFCSFKIVSLS